MKRLHVHVAVNDLSRSVRFYSTLFGAAPSVIKADYAKWMLEDPRVNFAISTGHGTAGLDHLGIQVERPDELEAVAARLGSAGEAVREQKQANCCYARSDKAWIADPEGISWETFFSLGESTVYGEDHAPGEMALAGPKPASRACCAP
ncbi:MAG TPA: ArsI/CadI family heavy metal resistance metalloenzyme [Alphaproteobacteria bacterium]|nr:ArsI/CadI family heavy metal resistance metalloenzyme [Alphaproteobacteria bacterium]